MADLLIVDDDVEVVELVAETLRARGHRCRLAHNGRDGLAAVREQRPDLVILDVDMPVLTGPDMACAMFLHDLGDEQIPLVLASGTVGLERVASIVGTPYYLSKPYTIDGLTRLVGQALEQRIPPRPPQAAS